MECSDCSENELSDFPLPCAEHAHQKRMEELDWREANGLLEKVICPNCQRECLEPTRKELSKYGGPNARGFYCSIECKWKYVGGKYAARMLVLSAMKKNPNWRYGQAIFNVVYSLEPDKADLVRGTDEDCFYRDENVEQFLWRVYGDD